MKEADIIIRNAVVLTVDEHNRVIRDGAVVVAGGKIVDVGESSIVSAYSARTDIDARGKIVMPGLVNSHTHVSMTIFRGMADDMPLHEWLNNYIFPAEAKFLTSANVVLGAKLACCEMLRSGTTTFADMYYYASDIARVASLAGMRCLLSEALIDFPVPNNPTPQHSLDNTEKLASTYRGERMVNIAVGPHSPYTCSPEWLQKGWQLAEKHDLPYHIHLAETAWERSMCLEKNGCSPVRNLLNLGVLGERTLAAHVIHADESDIAALARQKVNIANNPQSNMKLASGVCPVPSMLAAGCNVSLGTDGVVSNNSLDMFAEMKAAALIHKVHNNDPSLASAQEVIRMATINGAKSLGLNHITGSLEKGKRADIVMIDTNQPHAQPLYNVMSQVVYSLSGSDVEMVMVDGRVVVRNKMVISLDFDSIKDELTALSARIAKDMNIV